VPELALVELANGLIQTFQQIESRGRDARFHDAAIVFLTLASDQGAFFHAFEKAGHVGVVGNHAVADVAAGQPFGLGAAEDAEHVVLSPGQAVGFQELFGFLSQGVGDFLQGDENASFQLNGRGD